MKHKILFLLDEGDTENFCGTKVEKLIYRIENVPFYVKGVSFDDLVLVGINDNGEFIFEKVLKKSGHSTYRIYLLKNNQQVNFEKYWKLLEMIGCTYEKAFERFYSIDVPPSTNIYEAYNLLDVGEKAGVWEFEEGDCAHDLN